MVYRSIVVMLLVIQAQSHFLYGMGRPLVMLPKNEKLQKLMSRFSQKSKDQASSSEKIFNQIKELVKEGADVNITDEYGKTALHYAASQDDLEAVEIFIHAGADVNAIDRYLERRPLHLAAKYGNVDVVKILVANGADINIKNPSDGNTPLHLAVQNQDIRAMKLLIENEADINATNCYHETPLHYAACKGLSHFVRILIDYGSCHNAISNDDKTPHDYVLSVLKSAYCAVQKNRLNGIEDESEKIRLMQEIAHNSTEATEHEQLQVCLYMLEHPDQIGIIFSQNSTKSAKNCY